MPRKSKNANNPLGFSALGGAASLGNDVTNEIGKRSPRASMDCGQVQMPNQVILVPKKRRASRASLTHPWKVTGNGDDTVSIAAGCVLSYESQPGTLKLYRKYDGDQNATVEGEGVVYASIVSEMALSPDIRFSGTDDNGDIMDVDLFRLFPDSTAPLILSFAESTPVSSSGIFYFEVAEVSLNDGVAVVDYQIITTNPTLSSWIEGV